MNSLQRDGVFKDKVDLLLRQTQELASQVARQDASGEDQFLEYRPGVPYFETAARMFANVSSEILLVNGQPTRFGAAEVERLRLEIRGLCDRGVSVSLICHPDELESFGRTDFLRQAVKLNGAEARVSSVRFGAFVFDRRTVLMWGGFREPGSMVLRSSAVVEPVLRLTDLMWESASDLEVFLRCRKDSLDETVPQLLRLLSSGCKDDVAARRLGVSVRTYRRYVADLMEKLEADSRFQAGVRAAKLGLLEVE